MVVLLSRRHHFPIAIRSTQRNKYLAATKRAASIPPSCIKMGKFISLWLGSRFLPKCQTNEML
jgi:hypothetical protein